MSRPDRGPDPLPGRLGNTRRGHLTADSRGLADEPLIEKGVFQRDATPLLEAMR